MQIAFWICLGALVCVYVAYPLALAVAKRFERLRARVQDQSGPSLTLLISAYNEATVIREKLENALALDYPPERLEVVVISDGSDDGTDDVVRAFGDRGVVLYRQEPRQGKSAGLTRFAPRARGEILVFTDANSMFEPDAIRKLVRHFGDPKVGFVAGHQRYVEDGDSAVSESESLYWRYETWIKIQESRIGSVVCGDGAILAIRAELFEPLRDDDINDFVLPLKIVARGYRGVFDAEAVCYERTADDFSGEFRRKVRIVNRSLGAVLRVPQALNPFRVGRFAFQLFFHKVLRWFVPFFLVGMLASSLALALEGSLLYRGLFALQVGFYGVALLGFVPGARRLRVVYVPFYFCVVNAAAALGVLRLMLGSRIAVWNPQRPSATNAASDARVPSHSADR